MENNKKPHHIPNYEDLYLKISGNVSLAFSLFRLAPPAVCMKMMDEGIITDLNELSEKKVSLLGVKYTQLSGGRHSPAYPLWDEWVKDKESVWDSIKDSDKDPYLAHALQYSMIYAGANPWVEWNKEDYDNNTTCLASKACMYLDYNLLNFLFSHPGCPGPEYFDNLLISQTFLRNDSYHAEVRGDFPLLHYAANKGDVNLVKTLAEKGLDINKKDPYGRTAIFYTVKSDVLQYLIDKGASLSNVDKNGKNISSFWKKWIPTAAQQAEFNKIIIEKMKNTMTPEELRDLQKPALLHEITKGTKTNFEAIYKKSKFSPDVTFELPESKAVLSLATASMLNEEKGDLFINWCVKKNMGWDHEVWPGTGINDALFGAALGFNSGSVHPGAGINLANRYGSKPPHQKMQLFTKDVLKTCDKMIESDFSANKAMFTILGLFTSKSSNLSEKSNYINRINTTNLHSFISKATSYPNSKIDFGYKGQIPEIEKSVRTALFHGAKSATEILKKKSGYNYEYSKFNKESITLLSEELINLVSKGQKDALAGILFLFGISFVNFGSDTQFNYMTKSKSLNQIGSWRNDIIDFLGTVSTDYFDLSDEEMVHLRALINEVDKDNAPSIERFSALVTDNIIQNSIKSEITNKPSQSIKRKM